jgi:hypothetical protein
VTGQSLPEAIITRTAATTMAMDPPYPVDAESAISVEGGMAVPADQNAAEYRTDGQPDGDVVPVARCDELAQRAATMTPMISMDPPQGARTHPCSTRKSGTYAPVFTR